MSQTDQPSVRPFRLMVEADVPDAQAMTAGFGWPHRVEDWRLMQGLGQGVVAEHEGRLAGTALCWRYGEDWAALGLIGVTGALQGKGMGRRMMQALMQGLDGRCLVLHATEAGQALYASYGFVPTGSVVQYQGVVLAPPAVPLPGGASIRPIAPPDRGALLVMDRAATGMDRDHLLDALLAQGGGVVLERDGVVAGFALPRAFGRGQVIGPVVAETVEEAKALMTALLAARTGQFVRIDIPQETGLGPWLTTLGLADAGTVIRMVRGTEAARPGSAHTYGLASQAFG